MPAHFWTNNDGIHECWRMAEDVAVRSYQRIGECRRDREHGGFRAARYRLPAIFPECRNFSAVEEARCWIVEVLH
jgi:hypothetical protein